MGENWEKGDKGEVTRRMVGMEKSKMDPKAKAIAILFVLLVVGVVVGLIISKVSLDFAHQHAKMRIPQRVWQAFADVYTLGTIIICMNLFLLLGLLGFYIDSFRKTRSSFLLGLVLFLGVLFVQSLLSLPVFHVLLGQPSFQLRLINILPNFFETAALIILFYLSME